MERDVLRHSGDQRLDEVRWFHECFPLKWKMQLGEGGTPMR
jgi:hypothetical protein